MSLFLKCVCVAFSEVCLCRCFSSVLVLHCVPAITHKLPFTPHVCGGSNVQKSQKTFAANTFASKSDALTRPKGDIGWSALRDGQGIMTHGARPLLASRTTLSLHATHMLRDTHMLRNTRTGHLSRCHTQMLRDPLHHSLTLTHTDTCVCVYTRVCVCVS